MRVLVVTHYFPPEVGAPQARLSEFARCWATLGEKVTVLTGMPNHPTGVVPPSYRRRAVMEEATDGYRVVRTWLYATPNEGILKKTLGHVTFMATSILLGGSRIGPIDVVLVSSPTFLSIPAAWLLARWKRARFVVEIRDLWPAIFVELGILQNRVLITILELIELTAYRAADAVVVVSEGFRKSIVARGIPSEKVHLVPNGVDLELFRPLPADSGIMAKLGADPHEIIVLYVGAHGISHGLTSVADAAARLQDDAIRFIFVGEGSAKAELLQRVRDLGLTNVVMWDGVPHEAVPELMAAADICLVPLRD
ncbi:MAG: glycosyltransferase family 4 protein, partial [Actinobacteria bacterium]|nr:glycosyltransferase family 4 protein [Actinomycetota bacterium]